MNNFEVKQATIFVDGKPIGSLDGEITFTYPSNSVVLLPVSSGEITVTHKWDGADKKRIKKLLFMVFSPQYCPKHAASVRKRIRRMPK